MFARIRRVGVPQGAAVLVLVCLVAACSAALWATQPSGSFTLTATAFLVFAGMFLISEATQVHIEIRQQTWLFSLSEIPLVIGLYELHPAGILFARLCASIAVHVYQRVRPIKAFSM